MLGIKIKGIFLSLFADSTISFQRDNPVGLITDAQSVIRSAYSYPISIPLDYNNTSIIGQAGRLDTEGVLLQNEYCEVWVDGVLLDIGKATIKNSTKYTASLFMTFNEVKDIADVNLAALDLGGDREIGDDEDTRTAHADDTVENPLNYDYVFAPLYNPVYRPLWDAGFPTAQQRHYQNFYSSDDDGFREYAVTAVTPFIRFFYLIKQIFKHIGYTVDNQFQTSDELKKLLLYNNYNINTHTAPAISAWDSTINLKNHVPSRTCLDFLKQLMGTFALGLFWEPLDKTVLIIPYDTLIANPEAEDWTSKADEDYGKETDRDFICKWRFDVDTNDAISVKFGGEAYASQVMATWLTIRDALLVIHFTGVHFAIADQTYYYLGGSLAKYVAQDQKPVVKTGSDKEFVSELIPLWNSHNIETDGDENDALVYQEIMLPAIEHGGYIKEVSDAQYPCTSFRMMIYRGFQPADVGIDYTYPMANVTPYNIRGELIGEHSLLWDGDYGIYNKFWKRPYEMLKNKKTVTRLINLSIGDLVKFKFWKKYRIENQNYFIISMRYTITARGLSPVECVMITTL